MFSRTQEAENWRPSATDLTEEQVVCCVVVVAGGCIFNAGNGFVEFRLDDVVAATLATGSGLRANPGNKTTDSRYITVRDTKNNNNVMSDVKYQ